MIFTRLSKQRFYLYLQHAESRVARVLILTGKLAITVLHDR